MPRPPDGNTPEAIAGLRRAKIQAMLRMKV